MDAVPDDVPGLISDGRWTSAWRLHVPVVIGLSVALLLLYHLLYFHGLRSSDGVSYAGLARNVAEGKGLVSPVIQPGLMTVVPTTRSGQPFVIQAPLWPYLLGAWFSVLGASTVSVELLTGLLFVVVALESWWLARLFTGRVAAGYLAVAMTLTNPQLTGHALAATNVALQSALLAGLFLLMFARPAWWNVLATGLLLGLGIWTRENTIFMVLAVAICWYRWLVPVRRRTWWPAPDSTGQLARFGASLLIAVALMVSVSYLEGARKAAVLGRWDNPTVRMTFLYNTPVGSLVWYYIYDHPALYVDPVTYFRDHPSELVDKMLYQLWVAFVQQTLPAMIAFVPWFVPVMFPWLCSSERARVVGWSVLAVLAVQVVLGSTSFLHFSYFATFLPVIHALVAATAIGLARYAWRGTDRWSPGLRIISVSALVYAVLPLAVNVIWMAQGAQIPTGDFTLTAAQEHKLASFLRENSPDDAVITATHSSLLAWNARRTIVQYISQREYRPSGSPMWQAIDRQLRIDYMLLNSLGREDPTMEILPGFTLVATLDEPDVQAWLYQRGSGPTGP